MILDVKIKKKLKGFTLDVELYGNGNRMGILGASGCGKSMTLKCIAGIVTPDEGHIILNGRILYDSKKKINLPARKRNVGYLFQQYTLFPTMTVEENIKIATSVERKEEVKNIGEYLHKFQLDGLEQRYPSQLSGGQQQRVALARMLASSPHIILLDEPFSALDSYLKEQMQRELFTNLEAFEGNVLLVSHSRDEIYRFCDEVTVMEAGKKVISGGTKELFLAPEKIEVAKLTGCKNIECAEKIDRHKFFIPGWNLTLRTNPMELKDIKAIGIRAHSIQIVSDQSLPNSFPVVVEEVIETPFEIEYLVRNEIEKAEKAVWIKKEKGMGKKYQRGEHIYMNFPSDKILYLN